MKRKSGKILRSIVSIYQGKQTMISDILSQWQL